MNPPGRTPLTRRAVGMLAGGILGARTLLLKPDAAEGRKRRRRRRRRPTPSACARACGSACSFCFHRAAGSLLCGDGVGVACDESCASDDGCTDPLRRYCLVSSEDPATGAATELCLTAGGHCAQVNVCEA